MSPDSRCRSPGRGIARALLTSVEQQATDENGSIGTLLGQRVRGLRTARGLSQDALAEAVGTRAGVLSKIETGQSSVSLERLYALARALEVEPHALLPSSDELGRRSIREPTSRPATDLQGERKPVGGLSASLYEVAELLAEGCSDKDIASRTGRPLTTVRTYVARLYERSGLRSRAAIAKWWWTTQNAGLM